MNKDYIYYSLEEFLTDDYFIKSVQTPSRESVDFWEGYIAANPPNLGEYYAAKKYLQSSNSSLPFLTDSEVAQMWENIAAETGAKRRKRTFHLRPLVIFASVAASLLIAFFIWPDPSQPDGIYEFAGTHAGIEETEETQLILSDVKTVVINEKTSDISYEEKAAIKVVEEEISKEESAQYNQLVVPKGKMSRLTLADGTKVWVNANTRVVYPVEFTGKKREIYVDGEIYLEVVHDDKKPFIVKTVDLEVAVLGTQFSVCSYDNREMRRVVLVEGSVRVLEQKSRNKSLLEPDQMLIAGNGETRIEEVDVRKYISWKDGLYFFDREKLTDVAQRLSDYYGVRIICSEKAGSFLCSGKLDLKDSLDAVLGGLAKTMPITYEPVENDGYLIVLRK